MKIQSDDFPIKINGEELKESDLPSDVSLPIGTHEIIWTEDSLPSETRLDTILNQQLDGYGADSKSNWLNDAIKSKLQSRQPDVPDADKAFEQINDYFVDKEGNLDSGLDRVQILLDGGIGSVIDRAISEENYDIAKNRINQHPDMTDTEKDDLTSILDGTYN